MMSGARVKIDRTNGYQVLEVLTRIAGVKVPAEDKEKLLLALLRECEMLQTLRDGPASGEPIYGFDPRWR